VSLDPVTYMNRFIATEQFVDEITRLKEAYVLLEDLWLEVGRYKYRMLSVPTNLHNRMEEMFGSKLERHYGTD